MRFFFAFFFLIPLSNCAQNSEWVILNEGNSDLPALPVDMEFDEDNEAWMATHEGLLHYDRASFTLYDSSNSLLPVDSLTSIAIDADGDKWIATKGGGLVHFDGSNWNVHNSANSSLISNNLGPIVVDEDGNKWMSLEGDGLMKFDGSSWTHYNEANSGLPDDDPKTLLVDGTGDLWVGTPQSGLSEFDGSDWEAYTSSGSGLSSNYIMCVEEGPDGHIWVGTLLDGVAEFDGSSWTSYDQTDSDVLGQTISGIAIGPSGKVWVSTYGSGVLSIQDGNFTEYRSGNTLLPTDHTMGVYIDEWYNKWMVSDGFAIYRSGGVPVTEHPDLNSFSQQVHPNPFRKRARFEFELQEARRVKLRIRDVQGRIVRHFVDRRMGVGEHRLTWDGRKENGMLVPEGIYFYEGRIGQERFSGKLVKTE